MCKRLYIPIIILIITLGTTGCDQLKELLSDDPPPPVATETTKSEAPAKAEPVIKGSLKTAGLGRNAGSPTTLFLVERIGDKEKKWLEEQLVIYHRMMAPKVETIIEESTDTSSEEMLAAVQPILTKWRNKIPEPRTVTMQFNDEVTEIESSPELYNKYKEYYDYMSPSQILKDLAKMNELITEEMETYKAIAETEVNMGSDIKFFGIDSSEDRPETPELNDVMKARANFEWLSAFRRLCEQLKKEASDAIAMTQSTMSSDAKKTFSEYNSGGRSRLSPEEAWEDFQRMRKVQLTAAIEKATILSEPLPADKTFELEGEGKLIARVEIPEGYLYCPEGHELSPIEFQVERTTK